MLTNVVATSPSLKHLCTRDFKKQSNVKSHISRGD